MQKYCIKFFEQYKVFDNAYAICLKNAKSINNIAAVYQYEYFYLRRQTPRRGRFSQKTHELSEPVQLSQKMALHRCVGAVAGEEPIAFSWGLPYPRLHNAW